MFYLSELNNPRVDGLEIRHVKECLSKLQCEYFYDQMKTRFLNLSILVTCYQLESYVYIGVVKPKMIVHNFAEQKDAAMQVAPPPPPNNFRKT